ncbi:MAG: [Lentisphaeria bacterium]|nr:[FeFe] hydrogenase H-cluster maturation GTPase HydF [Lentisphaeria bacterium]
MENTPRSLRLHIALFGRTNVGKSSFLNMVSGQDTAITSPLPGTTTDAVEKTMELRPIGPVVFIDTAGLDDATALGRERVKRSWKVFDRADIAVILCEADVWGDTEQRVLAEALRRGIPAVAAVTKSDVAPPDAAFSGKLADLGVSAVAAVSGTDLARREKYLADFKKALIEVLPEDFVAPPPLLGGVLPPEGLAVLIVPVDIEAPKGRLIMPQVQTIRDALDRNAMVLTVKENAYAAALKSLNRRPDLVICDSQVVDLMVRDTPPDVPCTTFSILFSRLKGDIRLFAAGTKAIDELRDGDRILIAEACTHHASGDDIGRVKIPRWLRECTGARLEVDVSAGRDFPGDLARYKLVVQCGGCMLNRREMLSRLQAAAKEGVPVTNYGMCISYAKGVFDRVMSPFRSDLESF